MTGRNRDTQMGTSLQFEKNLIVDRHFPTAMSGDAAS
jgi:hypothetical protein